MDSKKVHQLFGGNQLEGATHSVFFSKKLLKILWLLRSYFIYFYVYVCVYIYEYVCIYMYIYLLLFHWNLFYLLIYLINLVDSIN